MKNDWGGGGGERMIEGANKVHNNEWGHLFASFNIRTWVRDLGLLQGTEG